MQAYALGGECSSLELGESTFTPLILLEAEKRGW